MNTLKGGSNAVNFFKLAIVAVAALTFVGLAIGASDVGSVAHNVTKSMQNLARLITAVAYVAGLGFAVAAILKFKAHKDNPTQIPVGTPIALLFVSAALVFLPSILGVTGKTLFDTDIKQGVTSGFYRIEGVN